MNKIGKIPYYSDEEKELIETTLWAIGFPEKQIRYYKHYILVRLPEEKEEGFLEQFEQYSNVIKDLNGGSKSGTELYEEWLDRMNLKNKDS